MFLWGLTDPLEGTVLAIAVAKSVPTFDTTDWGFSAGCEWRRMEMYFAGEPHNYNVDNFQKNLLELKKERRLTFKHIAEDLGLSHQTVNSQTRRDGYPPSLKTAVRYAKYFNVPLERLLS